MDLLGLATVLTTGLALGWAALVIHTVWALAHPPRRTYAYAVARALPGDPSEIPIPGAGPRALQYREWTFQSHGRSLPVWDVRGLDPSGPTVVVTHGWGDSRVVALWRLPALARSASRVLLWDLPGHGAAPGACTLGLREAADLRALLARLGDAPGPVVLYGSSLGAGVSIEVAASAPPVPVAAVITEAPYRLPFTPARNVLAVRALPWRTNLPVAVALIGALGGRGLSWWPRRNGSAGGFDRALHAAKLRVPLLVLHGTDDAVCPLRDGQAIAAAAPRGRIAVVEGGSHNNLWLRPELAERCAEVVGGFLEEHRRFPTTAIPS